MWVACPPTDWARPISTPRGATGGLFLEFVNRIKQHYSETYGADSQQVIDCSDGYRFEPQVAEKVLLEMIAEQGDKLEVRNRRQFNHEPSNVSKDGAALRQIKILNRVTGAEEVYNAAVFVDATYEGDLAAAAGAPYMLGREGADEYGEPCAGKYYQRWTEPAGPLLLHRARRQRRAVLQLSLGADQQPGEYDPDREARQLQSR